jgi:ubiquinone/menaquinone biosynthesis C-methylase UbiE
MGPEGDRGRILRPVRRAHITGAGEIVGRKAKPFQRDGQAPSGPGHDFFGHGNEIRAAVSRRLPKQPVRALDVGTGFGRNAVFLARQLPAGSHVWSVDPSEESLALGAKAVQEAGLAAVVTLGPGSAERLPFRDGEFDLTVGVMLFHHLVEVPPALREMGRVTKADGKLLIVDWGPTAHLLPFAIEHRVEDFYTPRAVEKMFMEAGFGPSVEQHPMWYVVEATKV